MKRIIQLLCILVVILNTSIFSSGAVFGAADSDEADTIEIMNTKSSKKIDLIPQYDKMSGRYGYVNAKGKWMIEPIFMDAKPFSHGLAVALEDSAAPKYGYIDSSGEFVIKPQYMSAYDFIEKMAIVTDNNRNVQVIDLKGKVVSKSKYYLVSIVEQNFRAIISDKPPHEGYKNIKYGVITSSGKIVKPQFEEYVTSPMVCFFNKNGTENLEDRAYHYISSKGSVIELPGQIESISENIGLIEYTSSKGYKNYAYITTEGKLYDRYGDYTFVYAKEFSEGFAAVCINTGKTPKDKSSDNWGFLKKDGSWLVEPNYTQADSFKDGVAPVKGESWWYITKDLDYFIEPFDNKKKLAEEKAYCAKKAKEIIKEIITPGMSDYEKVFSIYKYVTKTVRYDYENYETHNVPRVSYSAYGALKYNFAVCNGYALAMNLLLKQVGIETMIIVGPTKPDGVGHAWNLVKVGKNYYHLDATWDEDKSADKWNFFLKSDSYFRMRKEWNEKKYPAAPNDYK